MSTMANRKRATKKKRPQHQSDDVYIPSSLRKTPELPDTCPTCSRRPCECNQGRGKWGDPVGEMCGERWESALIPLCSMAIALSAGIGIGWWVWG